MAFSPNEADLLQSLEWRPRAITEPLLAARQRIGAGEPTETDATARLDGADRHLRSDAELRRGERAEHELLFGLQALFLVHLVAGRAQLAGLVMDERDDLPECERDPHAIHVRIVIGEIRPGEHRDLHLVFPGVSQRVILERQPDRSIEGLHLRRRIGDVHGIFIAALCCRRIPPAGVLAPGHVATAELRRRAIALVHDLLVPGDARIPLPADPPGLLRQVAVDIDRAEKTHPPAPAHHHGIVLVTKLALGPAVCFEVEHILRIALHRRQADGEPPAQKIRLVALAVAVVGDNAFVPIDNHLVVDRRS